MLLSPEQYATKHGFTIDIRRKDWPIHLFNEHPEHYIPYMTLVVKTLLEKEGIPAPSDKDIEENLKYHVTQERMRLYTAWLNNLNVRAIDNNHRAKPLLLEKGTDPHEIYLGVELEIMARDYDLRQSVAASIMKSIGKNYETCNDAICKHDGSLRDTDGTNRGFEIVTRPMSLMEQTGFWGKVFYSTAFANEDVEVDNRCGLHVHVSRKPLSKIQIGKCVVFVNREDNSKFIETMAGRTDNQYCRKLPKSLDQVGLGNEDRYEAINITNTSTIEFRIFSATKNVYDLLARIEFCRALVEYCAIADAKDTSSLNYKAFVSWLEGDNGVYDYLLLRKYIRENVCL